MLMALNPATVKLITQVVKKAAKDEETRKRLLILIFAPIVGILFVITLVFYIISSPFEAIAGFFKGNDLNKVSEVRADYALNQTLDNSDADFLESSNKDYSNLVFKDTLTEIHYFNQVDSRWANTAYGKTGTVGSSGCGPTALAIVISSLTGKIVTPVQMCEWSVKNGHRCEGNGSYHSLIPEGAKSFGLNVEGCSPKQAEKVLSSLASGKLVIAIMSKGHFTSKGHFIVLRGVTKEGKVLVADPVSYKRSEQEWDMNIIVNEVNKSASFGGPFWIIGLS